MDKLFQSLKGTFKSSSVETDNCVFRLHYRFTAPVLFGFSLLVTSKQFFGDPISCISRDDIPDKVLATFCWIHSTFSVRSAWHKDVGVEVEREKIITTFGHYFMASRSLKYGNTLAIMNVVLIFVVIKSRVVHILSKSKEQLHLRTVVPYPGVDRYTPGEDRVFHAYYQWVCFVLLLQAILFYAPRYYWKSYESGRIRNLTMDLKFPVPKSKKEPYKHVEPLANYLGSSLRHNGAYFAFYTLTELLNFVNVVGQIFLMDTFLGHTFSDYGIRVLSFTEWDESVRFDPMIHVFPRITKCVFHRFGSSGDVQKHDAMCILPINIVNEKIFVVVWFWFIFLAVVSAFALVYRAVLVSSRELQFKLLRARAKLVPPEWLSTVLKRCKPGDWFVIYLLSKNLDPQTFRDLMLVMADRLAVREPTLIPKVGKSEENLLHVEVDVGDSMAATSNVGKLVEDSLVLAAWSDVGNSANTSLAASPCVVRTREVEDSKV